MFVVLRGHSVTLEFADPALTGGAGRPVEPHFGAHYLTIMRLCLRQLGDRNDAEDATQETFRRAYQQRHYVVGDALPWLLTVARNVCVDELRRRNSSRGTLERTLALHAVRSEPQTIEGEGNPERVVVGRLFVGELLGQLTPAERRVVAGRVLSDESGGEAASAMGITASTTRVLFARAREKLRRYLENGQSVLGVIGFTGWRAVHATRRRVLGGPWLVSGRAELLLPALVVSALVGTGGAPAVALSGHPARTVGMSPAATLEFDGGGSRAGRTVPGGPPATGLTPARPGPAPASPGPGSTPPAGLAPAALLPAPDPHQVAVTDFEPSPTYSSDHTILMVGSGNCYTACSQLYRSSDGGASWTFVPTQGLQSSRLLLPPAGFGDGRFYGGGGSMLQVTTDGGGSFQNLAPNLGAAAAAPAWLNAQVVSADVALWLLGTSPAPQAAGVFPPGTTAAAAPLMLPSAAGWLDLQVVQTYPGGSGTPDQLLRCSVAGCAAGAQIPLTGAVQLLASPSFADDGTLVAIGGGVAVSRDGGASFHLVSSEDVFDASLVPGPHRPRLVAVDAVGGAQPSNVLTYSDDLGATWHAAALAPSARQGLYVRSPRLIAPGRLIASVADARNPGLHVFVCSADGAAWAGCAPDHAR